MTTFADQPLEAQIAQWRTYVRGRQVLHAADVEELEGHLRDQLSALTETGLTGDEAFLVAVKRMGNLDALSRERRRCTGQLMGARATQWRSIPGSLILLLSGLLGIGSTQRRPMSSHDKKQACTLAQ